LSVDAFLSDVLLAFKPHYPGQDCYRVQIDRVNVLIAFL
jgi:hypothetical protein